MRVCIFVANNCTVDSRVLRQAETFAGAGHDTTIVAVHRGDVPAVERRRGFEIRRVPSEYNWREGYPRLVGWPARLAGRKPLAIGDPPEPRAAAATKAAPGPVAPRGGKWAVLFVRRSRRYGRVALRYAKRGRRLVRRRLMLPTRRRQLERRMAREAIGLRADLYWANDVGTIRAAVAAARATGGRCVYDAHEVMWDAPTVPPLQRRLWGLVERTNIRRFNKLYTVCDPIAREMASRYRIEPPTVVLNCPRVSDTAGAPAKEDSPLRAYARPGERIVLFHGSLSAWRGLEQLVQAVPLLPEGFRLIVLGHGAFRSTLEQLVDTLALRERVTFIESVPPSELPAWLAGADVGTIPYQRHGRNHEYSTPNKLFEYMHLGIPVVVNDLPEIRRIVTEVGYGTITDCSDPAAIAKAIQDLVSDPARYEEMRARARAAAGRYSWEAQEPLILSALS